MAQVASVGAVPVMRLFDAPGWMTAKGQAKTAPTPAHYQDFANLCLAVAKRYPQIRAFVVWNEMDGFRSPNTQWDPARYTDMYNDVYTTLKSFNSALLVGGPYAPFATTTKSADYSHIPGMTGPWGHLDERSFATVTYWLQHKAGADFIAIDGRTALVDHYPAAPVASVEMFGAITRWLRSQTSLPIWWTEWYARDHTGNPQWSAIATDALITMASHGVSTALLWQPESSGISTESPTPGLWLTRTASPTPLVPVFRTLEALVGQQVTQGTPVPGVLTLTGAGMGIGLDLDSAAHVVSFLGHRVDLSPYEVSVVQSTGRVPLTATGPAFSATVPNGSSAGARSSSATPTGSSSSVVCPKAHRSRSGRRHRSRAAAACADSP